MVPVMPVPAIEAGEVSPERQRDDAFGNAGRARRLLDLEPLARGFATDEDQARRREVRGDGLKGTDKLSPPFPVTNRDLS